MQVNSITIPPRVQDLTGQTFNQLTALSYVSMSAHNGSCWLWQCTCGKHKIIFGSSVKTGNTKSCGCLQAKIVGNMRRTHGLAGKNRTLEYHSWASMIQRCTNTNEREYFRYGGRGITVCKRWRSFENFLADMGERPSSLHTIERINNDAGYSPENCKWATKAEQNRNMRRNRWITWNDETLCMTDWAARLGLTLGGLAHRLNNWSLERAMTEPVKAFVE